MPLIEALAERKCLTEDVKSSSAAQRAAYSFFAGHRNGWLTIFGDGVGDGYFLDTNRMTKPGHIFYNMAEVRCYVFFPSVRILVAAIIQCYSKGVIRFDWIVEPADP